jgi:hypothetical protein
MRGDVQNSGLGRSPQGLALNGGTSASKNAAVRSRLRNREITTRKQVGDAESMMNEEREGRNEAANSYAEQL